MHPSACSSSCLVAFLPRQFERSGGMCEYIALVTRAAAACSMHVQGTWNPRRDPVSPPHFCCQFSVGSFRRGRRRRSYITHTHRKLDRICLAARGKEGGGRAQFGAHALDGARRRRRRIEEANSAKLFSLSHPSAGGFPPPPPPQFALILRLKM